MSGLFGIPLIDLLVIAAYSLVMVAIGFLAMRRIKNQEDFFLGGRRFGKVLQTFAAFGQATSTENAVGAITTTYKNGAGGIWSQLALLWTTPVYWITSPWYRRMRLLTMGDFFHERYRSRGMAMFYSGVATIHMLLIIAVSLKALSATVVGMTLKPEAEFSPAERVEHVAALRLQELTTRSGTSELTPAENTELNTLRAEHPRREFSYINESWLTWFIVVIVLTYCLTGGLEAAVWSDTIQGVLILGLSIMLLPFGIAKLNSIHGTSGVVGAGEVLHRELPGHYFSLLGSAQNADFTWYFVIALCIMTSINVAVQANQLTAIAAGRDEHAARFGFTAGTMVKRYCSVAWGATGLLCFALYHREIENSDLVWGHATRDLLGGLGLGLMGLMLAAMFAALQSTASTLMISASSLFTKNVYSPVVAGRSERHYVTVGRVVSAVILVAAAILSLGFGSVLEGLKFLWEFSAIIAASFWCGIKWRRANRAGAWTSMSVSLVLFMVIPFGLPTVVPGLRSTETLLQTTQERSVVEEFAASPQDVAQRAAQIASWSGTGEAPAPLQVGDTIRRSTVVPPRLIYWSGKVELVDGVRRANGIFYPEMWALDKLLPLSENPFALNETIRYSYKILTPFLILIAVSLLTKRDDHESVRRFFVRMRTKVRADRVEDERVVQAAYANPESTRDVMLFPNSQIELHTWDREDVVGFLGWCVAAAGVVVLLWVILNIGA